MKKLIAILMLMFVITPLASSFASELLAPTDFVPVVAVVGDTDEIAAVTSTTEDVPIQVAIITAVTPVIIAAVKRFVPNIPKAWIPILAPIVGMSLEISLHFAAGTGISVWLGALLGGAGVGLRELYDQLKKAAT
jgi:hypothetical protein